MNIDIEKLVEKYYEGTSSLEEEKLLRNFLASNQIHEDCLIEEKMFELFSQEKQEKDASSAKQFLQSIPPTKRNRFSLNKFLYFSSGIAACLVFMLGIVFYQNEQKNTAYVVMNGVRINDKELAIEYINEALEKTSNAIDKGLKPLEKLKEAEDKLEEIKNQINY